MNNIRRDDMTHLTILDRIMDELLGSHYQIVSFNDVAPEDPEHIFWKRYSLHNTSCTAMAFGYPSRGEGTPPLWAPLNRYGVSGGAGNGDQHQIDLDFSKSIGVRVYDRVGGKWVLRSRKYSWGFIDDYRPFLPLIDYECNDYKITAYLKAAGILEIATCPFDDIGIHLSGIPLVSKVADWRLKVGR